MVRDRQACDGTIVPHAHESDPRLAVVRQVVGEGADCFPNVVASASAQNFLELDTIGFYLTQQPHQVFIFESRQSFDLLIFA